MTRLRFEAVYLNLNAQAMDLKALQSGYVESVRPTTKVISS